jgi:hypothetical protein
VYVDACRWGSKQGADITTFSYPENAVKIGELGAPGSYQLGSDHGGDSDVVVRLGKDDAGTQLEFSHVLNHISVWCEDFAVCTLPHSNFDKRVYH